MSLGTVEYYGALLKMEKPNRFILQHGEYEQRRIKKGESKVFVNLASTPFHRAYARGTLSTAQFESAKEYEKRYLAYWHRGEQRNILDNSVRGSAIDAESQQEAALRAKERLEEVEGAMVESEREIVLSVVVNHEAIGENSLRRKRFRLLVSGLDNIAKVLRLS